MRYLIAIINLTVAAASGICTQAVVYAEEGPVYPIVSDLIIKLGEIFPFVRYTDMSFWRRRTLYSIIISPFQDIWSTEFDSMTS
jgi:hypothetical protein